MGTKSIRDNYTSSSDKLDTLARKYFTSLIESAGQVYGSGELGTIPDIFPMLLMVVQESLAKLDPEGRQPEIEPGLSVTLESLDKDKIGPSAFVSFTSKLRHGTLLIGSFSPVKYLNWEASGELIKDISNEIDELFDDLHDVLSPIEWRDNKYEIITNIINERGHLLNLALNSRALSTRQSVKTVFYQPEQIILVSFTIDYENLPYTPELIKNTSQFWANRTGDADSFFSIIKAVQSASMEPLRQLNRDSITSDDRKVLFRYEAVLKDYSGEYKEEDCSKILDALKLGTVYDELVKKLFQRYLGMRAVIEIAEEYEKILGQFLNDPKIVLGFISFLKSRMRRNYSLGLVKINETTVVNEFLKNLVNLFREFKLDLNTYDKSLLNKAIIECDTKETFEKLKNVSFKLDAKTFGKFILNWSEEFSGLLPEEITLMLSTGIIYLVFDYQYMRFFGSMFAESPKKKLDMGIIREHARKSIKKGKISEMFY